MIEYVLKESDLLKAEHIPFYIVMNGGSDSFFPTEMKCLSQGVGFGNDFGDCSFWEDLDEEEQKKYRRFDGALFCTEVSNKKVILSNREIAYYMAIACEAYCKDYPETRNEIEGYIKSFIKLKGLK